MDLKEEYRKLIGTIQVSWQAKSGQKLTIEDIAHTLGVNRVTIQNLLGDRGKVNQKHLDMLKTAYAEILQNTTQTDETYYKDRLIEALERENKLLQEMVKDLRERFIQNLAEIKVSLTELKEGQKAVAAVAHAALFHAENISAFQQKKQLKELQKVSDKLIYEKAK